jgi:type I restriction enzyme, S subunit
VSEVANDELPKGWTAAMLGSLGSVGSSKRVHQQDWKSEGVPFFRAREIAELSRSGSVDNDLFITQELFEELSKYGFVPSPGDLMITGVGTIGVPYVVKANDKFYFKDASVLIFKNDHGLEPRYLFFFLKSKNCQEWIKEGSTGTTVDTLTIARAREIPIPLAPLAEQKRIADKLEAVLGRVDVCRARLDRVPDLLKRFRQSVLAAATSGQLTQTGQEDDSATWSKVPFEELLADKNKLSYGVLKPGDHDTDGVPMYRVVDIGEWGRANKTEPSYISKELSREFNRTIVEEGDILLSVMATIGRAIVASKEMAGANVNRALAVIKPDRTKVNSQFLMYYFLSPALVTEFEERSIGSAQVRINLGDLRQFIINLPPLAEQTEIVRRVEALFALADRIEARLATAQRLVERLTPATLSKAFRGDLVPQDPNDEPASKLLERLRGSEGPLPKTRRKKSG